MRISLTIQESRNEENFQETFLNEGKFLGNETVLHLAYQGSYMTLCISQNSKQSEFYCIKLKYNFFFFLEKNTYLIMKSVVNNPGKETVAKMAES